MYLFFSQAKCVVLQKLGDYYNCEVTFQNDGNKIKNEMQGLIDNLQVMKCYRRMQFICIYVTQDGLQCFFVFADAHMLR